MEKRFVILITVLVISVITVAGAITLFSFSSEDKTTHTVKWGIYETYCE